MPANYGSSKNPYVDPESFKTYIGSDSGPGSLYNFGGVPPNAQGSGVCVGAVPVDPTYNRFNQNPSHISRGSMAPVTRVNPWSPHDANAAVPSQRRSYTMQSYLTSADDKLQHYLNHSDDPRQN